MKPWHQQDRFWHTWAPVLFHKERWQKTPEQVDHFTALLNMEPPASVLDLGCGPGRHSLELARRGFKVTGVDRTKVYLAKARQQAEKEGLNIEFVQKDMRRFCRSQNFDICINLFTSFGYFKDIGDDKRVLGNVYRSLRNKGRFLMELMGKEVLARIFRERDWYTLEDMMVLEERKVCKNWSWIENRWIMIKKGKVQEFRISHRLYSAEELSSLLRQAGFKKVDVYSDFTGAPYDNNAKRLILAAYK